jgi:hypothetical protein
MSATEIMLATWIDYQIGCDSVANYNTISQEVQWIYENLEVNYSKEELLKKTQHDTSQHIRQYSRAVHKFESTKVTKIQH